MSHRDLPVLCSNFQCGKSYTQKTQFSVSSSPQPCTRTGTHRKHYQQSGRSLHLKCDQKAQQNKIWHNILRPSTSTDNNSFIRKSLASVSRTMYHKPGNLDLDNALRKWSLEQVFTRVTVFHRARSVVQLQTSQPSSGCCSQNSRLDQCG